MTWDIPAMIQAGLGVLNKILPEKLDPNKAQEFEHEFRTQLVAMQAEQLRGQVEINKVEAAHPSVFVAGWRPFIGWVCGVALGWQFIGEPVAGWVATMTGYTGELPRVSGDNLFELVLAMLGMAGWRTLDKMKGTETDRVEVRRATRS